MCLASMLTEKGLSFLEFWLFCQMEPGSNGSQCREGSWDAAAEVQAHLDTVHSNGRFWCVKVDAASATGGYVFVSARVCGHKIFAFFLVLNLRNDLLKTTFIYLSSLRSRTVIKGMKSRTVFHFSDSELDKFPPLPAFLIEALHRSASRPSLDFVLCQGRKDFKAPLSSSFLRKCQGETAPQAKVGFPSPASSFLHPSTSAKGYLLDTINKYQLCFNLPKLKYICYMSTFY